MTISLAFLAPDLRDRTCDPYHVNEAAKAKIALQSVTYGRVHGRTSVDHTRNGSCATRKSRANFKHTGSRQIARSVVIREEEQHPARLRRAGIAPGSRRVVRAAHPLRRQPQYFSIARQGDVCPATRCSMCSIGWGNHGRATTHGFRAVASTILNESNHFNRDWIERQLAHVERNEVRRAYNAAEWMPDRRRMMQWWADHITALTLERIRYHERASANCGK